MLPVSIVAHVAAFVAFLVIPLLADVDMPTPWPLNSAREYVAAAAMPKPVPFEPVRRSRDVFSDVPTSPPDRIADEIPVSPPGPVADGGLPVNGIGDFATVGRGIVGEPPAPPPPPPPPPQRPAFVRPGGSIREPKKIAAVPPIYPEIARAARIEGVVIVEATIDERGAVIDARVLRSVPLLDAAAITAVRQWRYTPTLLNGVRSRSS
jgi:protein TonB